MDGSGGTMYVGSWGAHAPNFSKEAVVAGEHPFVLAISGEADNYGGWARALHKEAGRTDDMVVVHPGRSVTVCMRLTIGPPVRLARVEFGD